MAGERRVWQRIGARCFDRGQFICTIITADGQTRVGDIVWRKGQWVPDPDRKAQQQKPAGGGPEAPPTREELKTGNAGHEHESFVFSGPGYRDCECTEQLYPEEEFQGVR